MKRPLLGLCLVLLTHPLMAQTRGTEAFTDTARAEHVVILDPGISSGRPSLLLPASLGGEAMVRLPFFALPGMDRAVPPPFLDWGAEHKVDLLLPMRLADAEQPGIRTIRIVLGSVQAAGVAYIAYRHLKKYGLFK